jgi:GNAT superfamily N-acetyltransferase
MASSAPNRLLDETERAIAQRLMDEINRFNLDATGIRGFHEVLNVETDDDGEVVAGVYGWCWGGTCWIDALWVRDDARRHGLGGRLLDAVEAEARTRGCHQLALETHTFQAPAFYQGKGFEIVGTLTDYPIGHAELLLRKPLPPNGRVVRIRHATAGEAERLEGLQRRSSDVWEAYREQLAAHPDAIELPETFINRGWVRVAVTDDDAPIGFSVVIPTDDLVHDLDGLFVEPASLRCGVGRALVEDAAARAAEAGARCLEVTAGPAQGFYEKVGFQLVGTTQTRFGPAVRMRRSLQGSLPHWAMSLGRW